MGLTVGSAMGVELGLTLDGLAVESVMGTKLDGFAVGCSVGLND